MMLDFTQREKRCLPIKLYDGTVISLGIPKKKLYARIVSLERLLKDSSNIENVYDEIAKTTAEVLSNNREDRTFATEEIEKIMDIEDMALIITEYGKFTGAVLGNPN